MMRIGWSATRDGMTDRQKLALRDILSQYRNCISEFHHGDCVGGDEEAHHIAAEILGVDRIHVHPPTNPKKRAFCQSPHMYPPEDYLPRDRRIVDMTDGLFAAPKTEVEQLRSGTWTTIRYARNKNRFWKLLKP